MNTLNIFLGFAVNVSLLEIIIFQVGAIVLGFAIHFFLRNRQSMSGLHDTLPRADNKINEADQWRLKYYDELDKKDQRYEALERELQDVRQREQLTATKLEALELQYEQEYQERKSKPKPPAVSYMDQLKHAHENLTEHDRQMRSLLEQIRQLKISEQKYMDVLHTNEDLHRQLRDTRKALNDKENELRQAKQELLLAEEMKDRVKKIYEECGVLESQLQKVTGYLETPHHTSQEYEQLQQSYLRITKDFDEVKAKQFSLIEENQRLSRLLSDTDDKLREANFQRQQLLKKVGYLEEMSTDLQQLSDHQKKLDMQLRRITEIENLLSKISDIKPDA